MNEKQNDAARRDEADERERRVCEDRERVQREIERMLREGEVPY